MPPKTNNSNNSGNRSLPKFGEWDVNNPQSAEGFTVIFNTARDQKKNDKGDTTTAGSNQNNPAQGQQNQKQKHKDSQHAKKKKKWLCCVFN